MKIVGAAWEAGRCHGCMNQFRNPGPMPLGILWSVTWDVGDGPLYIHETWRGGVVIGTIGAGEILEIPMQDRNTHLVGASLCSQCLAAYLSVEAEIATRKESEENDEKYPLSRAD